MEKSILNIQLSSFCDSPIKVDAKTSTSIVSELNKNSDIEFLPNIIVLPTLNMMTGKIDNIQTLAFSSTKQTESIVCNGNRIDIVFNLLPEKSFNETINSILNIMVLLMTKYDLRANRLAVNITWSSNTNTKFDNEYENKYLKNFKSLAIGEIKQWSTRILFEKNIKTENLNEPVNVVVSQNKELESQEVYHIDINTKQERQFFRFKQDNLKNYFNCLIDLLYEVMGEKKL